jgi:hypothetical protein
LIDAETRRLLTALAAWHDRAANAALFAHIFRNGCTERGCNLIVITRHWADNPVVGYKMINARGESVATKPSFRKAFKQRRYLIGQPFGPQHCVE